MWIRDGGDRLPRPWITTLWPCLAADDSWIYSVGFPNYDRRSSSNVAKRHASTQHAQPPNTDA